MNIARVETMQRGPADLILSNARVPTVEGAKGTPWFVAIKGDKILGVGDKGEVSYFKGPGTRDMDCQGMALVPGFIDAHCHLLALASSLRSADCRPEKASSISQIISAIRQQAEGTGVDSWIRAFGYDEFYLAEKHHPDRWDLDRAAPDHPVRLDHRTGHASVLNSRALALLNISRHTPDPPDGVIERDEATGEPTGVLYEMAGQIRGGTQGTRDKEDFQRGVKAASHLLLSKGITSIQDASPGNDVRRWHTFVKLKEEGHLTPRATLMAGESHLQSFLDLGLAPGSGDGSLRVGAIKVMLSCATGALQPPPEELRRVVMSVHRRGFQLAIHAVEEEAVDAAAAALLYAQESLPLPNRRHRIEHCSECPPPILEKLKTSRALVVTQPSFVHDVGEKYISMVDEGLQPHLYPVASLIRAGILVAAGSDAPVTSPDPCLSIYSAVTRRTRGGSVLHTSQTIPVDAALKMHSINSAYASFDETTKGSIEGGKLADLALLDVDPTVAEPEAFKEAQVMMTMIAGEVVWQR